MIRKRFVPFILMHILQSCALGNRVLQLHGRSDHFYFPGYDPGSAVIIESSPTRFMNLSKTLNIGETLKQISKTVDQFVVCSEVSIFRHLGDSTATAQVQVTSESPSNTPKIVTQEYIVSEFDRTDTRFLSLIRSMKCQEYGQECLIFGYGGVEAFKVTKTETSFLGYFWATNSSTYFGNPRDAVLVYDVEFVPGTTHFLTSETTKTGIFKWSILSNSSYSLMTVTPEKEEDYSIRHIRLIENTPYLINSFSLNSKIGVNDFTKMKNLGFMERQGSQRSNFMLEYYSRDPSKSKILAAGFDEVQIFNYNQKAYLRRIGVNSPCLGIKIIPESDYFYSRIQSSISVYSLLNKAETAKIDPKGDSVNFGGYISRVDFQFQPRDMVWDDVENRLVYGSDVFLGSFKFVYNKEITHKAPEAVAGKVVNQATYCHQSCCFCEYLLGRSGCSEFRVGVTDLVEPASLKPSCPRPSTSAAQGSTPLCSKFSNPDLEAVYVRKVDSHPRNILPEGSFYPLKWQEIDKSEIQVKGCFLSKKPFPPGEGSYVDWINNPPAQASLNGELEAKENATEPQKQPLPENQTEYTKEMIQGFKPARRRGILKNNPLMVVITLCIFLGLFFGLMIYLIFFGCNFGYGAARQALTQLQESRRDNKPAEVPQDEEISIKDENLVQSENKAPGKSIEMISHKKKRKEMMDESSVNPLIENSFSFGKRGEMAQDRENRENREKGQARERGGVRRKKRRHHSRKRKHEHQHRPRREKVKERGGTKRFKMYHGGPGKRNEGERRKNSLMNELGNRRFASIPQNFRQQKN